MSSTCPKGCVHDLGVHMAHGCPMCDCGASGTYLPNVPPDNTGGWVPPATIGGNWTRLDPLTGIYETWPARGTR